MKCPTVSICADNEDGFTDINESDFDKTKHKLFKVKAKKKPKKK